MNSQLFSWLHCYKARGVIPQSTYIPRVPQCKSPRRYWDFPPTPSLTGERVPPPPPQLKGGTLACGWGNRGSQFGRLEKKPRILSTLWVIPLPWRQSEPSLQRKKFPLCGLDIYFPNIEDLWYCGNFRQFTLWTIKNILYRVGIMLGLNPLVSAFITKYKGKFEKIIKKCKDWLFHLWKRILNFKRGMQLFINQWLMTRFGNFR